MKIKNIAIVLLVVFLLASCAPATEIAPTKTIVALSTSTFTPPALTPPSSLELTPTPYSLIDLRGIISASDPTSLDYDPASKEYAEFPTAVNQAAFRNGETMSDDRMQLFYMLGWAIYFPRADAYLAGQAVITYGPDVVGPQALVLFSSMLPLPTTNSRARAVSLIVIGTIGKDASCALGNIGPLLWDTDPSTRTAAAWAIEKITAKKVISDEIEKSINPSELKSITPDLPEGKIVAEARTWWTEQGSKVNWRAKSNMDMCHP